MTVLPNILMFIYHRTNPNPAHVIFAEEDFLEWLDEWKVWATRDPAGRGMRLDITPEMMEALGVVHFEVVPA